MKKKILSIVLCSCFALGVVAQEYQPKIGYSTETGAKTNFKKNKATDNWFISIAGGGSMLIGDDNGKASFSERLNINPQLSFGKWFNPYFAFRVQLTGGPLVGYDADRTAPELFKQKNTYFASHADFLLDVTNLWAPYRETKVFRLIPWVGLGYAQRFKNQDISRTETPSINGGILTAFRLSKRVDLNLEIQGLLLNEDFNRIYKYHLTDFIAQGSVGLTFKLGKTDFEVIEPMDYALLNDLNNQINTLRSENETLSKRPVACKECPSVVPAQVVNNYYAENVVYFRLNSAKVDNNQQINIYNTAEFMKESQKPIKVIGYADKKTGTSSYNLTLSEKRARAVAKELIEKYGISSERISIEWKGSDVQPFDENNWNRVVIMTTEK